MPWSGPTKGKKTKNKQQQQQKKQEDGLKKIYYGIVDPLPNLSKMVQVYFQNTVSRGTLPQNTRRREV